MSEKKNFFARAYEAVIDARMKHVEHEVARYRVMFDLSDIEKGR